MRVSVGDCRLFVEVVGPLLLREHGNVVKRPTLLFIHGGPGFDHLSLRSGLEVLADTAQLVFFDQRGHGRSDRSTPEHWNLGQWSRDVHALIEALGIERPIIFGQSFGGLVAQRFAVEYQGEYAGLILSSTVARFDLTRITETFRFMHGDEIAGLVQRYFTERTPQVAQAYAERCFPLYTVRQSPLGPESIRTPEVAAHFFSRGGEGLDFDSTRELYRVNVPTLVLGGDRDPTVPRSALDELVVHLPNALAEIAVFESCGHGPARDRPDETCAVIRRWIAHHFKREHP